jgi:hypothetical protein
MDLIGEAIEEVELSAVNLVEIAVFVVVVTHVFVMCHVT